jgi:hypothetical protein
MIYDNARVIHYEKYDKKVHLQESNFLCYKQMNSFIYNITFYICKLNYVGVCNISFKEHLPEDGHNR